MQDVLIVGTLLGLGGGLGHNWLSDPRMAWPGWVSKAILRGTVGLSAGSLPVRNTGDLGHGWRSICVACAWGLEPERRIYQHFIEITFI